MTTTLKGNSSTIFDINYDDVRDLATSKGGLKKTYTQTYTDGTGDNQGDILFVDQRTGTETIDLTSTLTDEYGNTVVLTKIKELFIKNTSAVDATTDLVLSGNALTAFGTITNITLKPQGVFHIRAPESEGYTITNTTQDQLTLTGAAVGYDIFIIGSTA